MPRSPDWWAPPAAGDYVTPRAELEAFHCPRCAVFAQQLWGPLNAGIPTAGRAVPDWRASDCQHCHQMSLWKGETLMFPAGAGAPPASKGFTAETSADYGEAADILALSPRGAAALLRLCVQKLCIELGEDGENLNKAIGKLVRRGLPKEVQRMLDIVRVIGNDAVHPGQIDLRDDTATASTLFPLVNWIADELIVKPGELDTLYASLPETKRAQIERRDAAPRAEAETPGATEEPPAGD